MSAVWNDPRLGDGVERQLARRDERLAAGESPLGWKVAFGSPEALANLGLSAPLVGFLTNASLLANDATYPLAGTVKFALEPEIALHLGADLPGGSDEDAARAAIAAVGPALELADLDLPLDRLEEIVATNIFQRRVVLGQGDPERAGGLVDGLVARVFLDGEEAAVVEDPQRATGQMVDVLLHVADFLAASGAALRAGDVVITGSVTPLYWVEPGQSFRYELGNYEPLKVSFA